MKYGFEATVSISFSFMYVRDRKNSLGVHLRWKLLRTWKSKSGEMTFGLSAY